MDVVLVTVNWREIACSDAFEADVNHNRVLSYSTWGVKKGLSVFMILLKG